MPSTKRVPTRWLHKTTLTKRLALDTLICAYVVLGYLVAIWAVSSIVLIASSAIILEVIDQEVEEGRTVLVTTHNLEEARCCDQVLLLDNSAIAVGKPDYVLTEENLRCAFGGRFIRVGDQFILDDPHHSH